MSLETDIKRIADALEKLSLTYQPGVTVTATKQEEAVTGPISTEVTTLAQLKSLAQTIAAGLPEGGVDAYTDFVRNSVCAKLGVKKLVEIPAERIPEAAKLLQAYKA